MTPENFGLNSALNLAINHGFLDAAQIAQLIPHHGDMSLLAGVNSFDADNIHCSAQSHRYPNNPLRENGMLGAVCGVEYAAQAMAIHGALSSQKNASQPRGGRLASVRSVDIFVARLDTIQEDLDVHATLLMNDENSMMYEFTVSTPSQILLKGKATVILMPKESE
jgi:predicted hotdog family 3-hydroxylacyl-ACP dehydratase